MQLLLRLREYIFLLELDRPIYRHLRPHQNPQLVRGPRHPLVVRIVRQPHKVPAQILHPAQQSGHVPVVVHAPGAERRLGVDAYAVQHNRFAVQQNLRPRCLNRSEAHLVRQRVCSRLQHHVVELRSLRRPQGQPRRRHADGDPPVCIRHALRMQLRRRQIDRNLGPRLRALHMHIPLDHAPRRPVQMQLEVVDKALRHRHQRDVARQSAVVVPIRLQCRNAVGDPCAVYKNDHAVAARLHRLCRLAVERRIPALVRAQQLPVHPHARAVVRRADVQERPVPRLRLILEVPLVPEAALVVQQRHPLRVPVARHLDRRALCKAVLQQLVASRRQFLIHWVAAASAPAAIQVWIEDVVPLSVQTQRQPLVDSHQLCRGRGRRRTGGPLRVQRRRTNADQAYK